MFLSDVESHWWPKATIPRDVCDLDAECDGQCAEIPHGKHCLLRQAAEQLSA